MVALNDYSGLKRTERVEIPLNGEVYYAEPDPPAGTTLASLGAFTPDEITAMATAMKARADDTTEDVDVAVMLQASAAGMNNTRRAVKFMDDVLEPESASRWASNMMPAKDDWTAAQKKKHAAKHITLAQVMAVYGDLVAHYSNRPTTPSSSSQNGRGGTGGTSTAGASAKG